MVELLRLIGIGSAIGSAGLDNGDDLIEISSAAAAVRAFFPLVFAVERSETIRFAEVAREREIVPAAFLTASAADTGIGLPESFSVASFCDGASPIVETCSMRGIMRECCCGFGEKIRSLITMCQVGG